MSKGTMLTNAMIIGSMLVIVKQYNLPPIIAIIILLHTVLSTMYLTQLEGSRD